VAPAGAAGRYTVSTSWMELYCVFAEKKLVVIGTPEVGGSPSWAALTN
jgi:hypothetical protein